MAFQTIGTFKNVYEWEQPEIIDEFASTGETIKIVQDYARFTADVIVKQETFTNENRSNFLAELWFNITAGENGEGFTFEAHKGTYSSSFLRIVDTTQSRTAMICRKNISGNYIETYKIAPGETKTIKINDLDLSDVMYYMPGYDNVGSWTDSNYGLNIRHKLDGTFPPYISNHKIELNFSGGIWAYLKDILIKDDDTKQISITGGFADIKPIPLSINRAVIPITAANFNDEGTPSLTYNAPVGAQSYYEYSNYPYIGADTVVSFQVALSFDGETPVIDYREIPINSTNYIFELTNAERELLRVKAQGSDSLPIYYLTKVIRSLSNSLANDSKTFVNAAERIFTVIGSKPSLSPTVIDVNSDTIALTGNPNIFVRYESMVEFSTGATASKHATIVSQSVQCGSKTIYNLYNGVISDIESGSFIFNATDSRGLHADQVVITNTAMIEYVKPTCKQDLKIEVSGETGATITLTISGNYYNGSFGAVNNTLALDVRYAPSGSTMGNWTRLTGTPTFDGNTYELTTVFTGFQYDKGYVFQCRATDKLNFVETSQYTLKLLPVFDWSETDFNFNVPIQMNNETILRHNETAKNTVLSASGGKVYIRPQGTDTSGGEAIFYSNGDAAFNGGIYVGGAIETMDSLIIGEYAVNDFVIETGETSMGSNGTWYWRKWASGKSEAWGCRNFGNMAVTTAWGNLYRSAIFTQDLPSKVFIRTPDSININIVHANFGGWICKHEQTAPSAVTTGSFIFVRPASATVTLTNLIYHYTPTN